ncbi:hypothetical protein CDV36_016245 [Fusarium kuroshium]|uniref:Uncharacterized protein n=2 Tax=Fusarium solani species complex TaxID=232080 RepID=A0A3M2QVZ6_9HYPO|nr:hypothetical protein CDV36_016245 [Fusarium kuroshium]RSL41664.1 hypothetical protein CEP51_016562 [Fusarium floridanum]
MTNRTMPQRARPEHLAAHRLWGTESYTIRHHLGTTWLGKNGVWPGYRASYNQLRENAFRLQYRQSELMTATATATATTTPTMIADGRISSPGTTGAAARNAAATA